MKELKLKVAWVLLVALLVGVEANVSVADDDKDERGEEEVNYLGIDMLSYRDAKALGRAEKKPVFFHFTAAFTGNTGAQMKDTLEDKRVIKYLNQNFASATINVNELPALARKYDVKSAPTIMFLDSSGKTLTSLKGAVAADKFLSIAQYVVEKAYKKIGYQDWAEKEELRARGDGGD